MTWLLIVSKYRFYCPWISFLTFCPCSSPQWQTPVLHSTRIWQLDIWCTPRLLPGRQPPDAKNYHAQYTCRSTDSYGFRIEYHTLQPREKNLISRLLPRHYTHSIVNSTASIGDKLYISNRDWLPLSLQVQHGSFRWLPSSLPDLHVLFLVGYFSIKDEGV